MRIFITLICGLVINFTWTQLQDDFSSNATFPSSWGGQTADFQIQNESLQLNAASAGNSTIYLAPSFFYYSETEIRLKIDLSFSPSGNNRLNLFIFSDSVNVLNAQNAFYVQFGESGSNDAVSLRGIFDGQDLELIRGLDGRISSSFELDLKLIWSDSLIQAELWNSSSNSYETEWTYIDTNYREPNILSLNCNYTSSNSNNFAFDDLYLGPIEYDTIPPAISGIETMDSTTIRVYFDEPIDTTNFNLSWIDLNNPNQQEPIHYFYENGALDLTFPQSFSNATWSTIQFDTIKDLEGNSIDLDTTFHLIYGETATYQDIEITEIMSDPSPPQFLPECEYVEIYNASSKIINLKGLHFADAGDTNLIDSNVFLFPETYFLLVDPAYLDSFSIQNKLGIDLPSLNNSADWIALLSMDSSLIDSVNYASSWHESTKDDGGFSLEKAELGFSCGSSNWLSSQDSSGGTPGLPNSIYQSDWNTSFQLVDWEVPHGNQIQLFFNKNIEDALQGAQMSCNFYLVSYSASNNELNLNIGQEAFAGDLVEVELMNLIDCFGNQLDTNIQFEVPFSAGISELLINEILFDPESGGSDFVELYNSTEKTIDLSGLILANRENDTIANRKSLVFHKFLLQPEEYCVISKDSNWLKNVFETDIGRKFIQISSLPSFPNDFGSVLLVNDQDDIIDEVNYTQNMHYPLLEDFENKSLERITFSAPSLDANNWNTASGNTNFGTPGYQNSQFIDSTYSGSLSLSSDHFSPNNDGLNDNLSIGLEVYMSSIVHLKVFNMLGQEIIKLIDAEYLSGNYSTVWDGKDSNGNLCNSGIYIFHLLLISDGGRKSSKRKTAYLKR